MLWTQFPDELDKSALMLVLDAYRGKPIERDAAALAAFNVAGFIYGKGFALPLAGDGPGLPTPPTDEDVDAAFAAASAWLGPAMTAAGEKANAVPWGLVFTIAIKVIGLFRGL
jgi:hypothetical protein